MRILITGNMGYIGPSVVERLRTNHPNASLIGLDTGYYASCLSTTGGFPERLLNAQHFADVRQFPESLLEGLDAVIHLAAISNDPIGNRYEMVTIDVNYKASIHLAKKAKAAGVKSFVFASSCSMYGAADDGPRTENSPLNPLTTYAKSKVLAERDLEPLASPDFRITALRFSTACGWTARLRLDLVLNDFVASAVASGTINILSDGTPWRPLIDTQDMAKAIDWAIERDNSCDPHFLAVNVGCNDGNYQVRDIAEAVVKVIPGTRVTVNKDARPDKRSYRVSFDLFKTLAPLHQPSIRLEDSIRNLKNGLESIGFNDKKFRNSLFMRLNILDNLRTQSLIDEKLRWTDR